MFVVEMYTILHMKNALTISILSTDKIDMIIVVQLKLYSILLLLYNKEY